MTTKTLHALGHDACILASLIEGLDALHSASDGPDECPLAKRARNAMQPAIEVVIEKAWALNEEIERADMANRKK